MLEKNLKNEKKIFEEYLNIEKLKNDQNVLILKQQEEEKQKKKERKLKLEKIEEKKRIKKI
jgi:hypothetical protein